MKNCFTCELLDWKECQLNCSTSKHFNPLDKRVTHDIETLAVLIDNQKIGFSTQEEFKKGVIGFHVKKETFKKLNNIKNKGDQLSLF